MIDIIGIIKYYVNLLIIQYHNKPKAQATVELLIKELIADGITFDVRDGYSVDTAIGVQLDVIGQYVGVDRYYEGQTFDGYFAFTDYAEVVIPATKKGFAQYANFATIIGKFLQYYDVLSATLRLNDDDFRLLIRLKIIQNSSNHSHKSINDAMYDFFGDTLRPDSIGHMQMFYFVLQPATALAQAAMQKKILPKPMGVQLFLITQTTIFFGFAEYAGYSSFIEGFTTYAGYDTKVGETLKYSKITV